mmetsp:Transcript_19261/g.41498  ORF Transcript_19261/g.41498 Transcript_19261/m.41498 type:complete len:80 (+) Transcript_19261:436-675(+)
MMTKMLHASRMGLVFQRCWGYSGIETMEMVHTAQIGLDFRNCWGWSVIGMVESDLSVLFALILLHSLAGLLEVMVIMLL